MGKWNEQAAVNNNLSPASIRSSERVHSEEEHEFSEELSDGGERNKIINKNQKK